jgi:peptidyl-prolyl cis-trans isomerase SurA
LSAQQVNGTSVTVTGGAPAAPPIQRVLPYPRGRWRLSTQEELSQVVVWFSHVLIRHSDVLDHGVSFSPLEWTSTPPRSQLSRDDALILSRRIADEAASGKVSFDDLAARYSEDITTAQRGGSMGGVTASFISPWWQILDALAVLEPGQTSEVIETPFGFHILEKRAPPPEQKVSGARIVIAHEDAPAIRLAHSRGRVPNRSRVEAEKLAREIFERARNNPAEFPQLVERYSEHIDAESQGDLGEWSTHEAQSPEREIETLAQLQVGDVSPPIETLYGFQILMRTPNRERVEFAHEALELFFDPRALEGVPDSEAKVREQAVELAERIRREPQAFDVLRKELCCHQSHVWREGRREKSVQTALAGLAVGAISTTPVRTLSSFAILRRLDPKNVPRPPATKTVLPSDVKPNIYEFLGYTLDDRTAELLVHSLGKLAADELELQGDRRARLLAAHELRQGIGSGDDRVRAVNAATSATESLLDTAEHEQYVALARRLVENAVLHQSLSVPGR